jgi:hypothetical protein
MRIQDMSPHSVAGLCVGGLALLVLVVVLCFCTYWSYWSWSSKTNDGATHGYYGEFNRVASALESIPGVVITDSWQHKDVTLEDFGFQMRSGDTEDIHLRFHEGNDVVKLRGRELVRKLQTMIEQEEPANKPGRR